ncbi:MAG: hypothetical protein CMP11_03695, partial [Zetaproteobacteria bacterium]|nr:hypothetical protein [Pseudobdellovibrionaceae bacterium]
MFFKNFILFFSLFLIFSCNKKSGSSSNSNRAKVSASNTCSEEDFQLAQAVNVIPSRQSILSQGISSAPGVNFLIDETSKTYLHQDSSSCNVLANPEVEG